MKLKTDVDQGELDYSFQMARSEGLQNKTKPKRFPHAPSTLEELWALVGFLQGEYERRAASPSPEYVLTIQEKKNDKPNQG